MLRPTEVVTAKQLAANRANAQHSTGPTTERGKQVSSQNHFKHGYYAQLQPEVMAALHEDPVEKANILVGVTKSYPPETDAQQMMVDDLADLRWQRVQIVRSRGAKMALTVKEVDRQRDRLHLQISHNVAEVSQAEVLEKGLRNIPDSPAKFEMLIDKFKDLIRQVEECNYSDALPYLTAIYGKQASLRGAAIFNRFIDLDRLGRERQAAFEARRPWPPADDPLYEQGPVPKAGQQEPHHDPRLDEPSALLLQELNLELRDVQEFYRFFVEDKITVTQMNRDAAVAPTRESLIAARELYIVDRAIEAKTRLLMKMRVDDRNWRLLKQQDQGSEEKAAAARPADPGSSAPAGSVGSGGAPPQEDSEREATPGTAEEEAAPTVAPSEAGPANHANPRQDEKPEASASRLGSTLATPPLLILIFLLVLHLVLSLTQGLGRRGKIVLEARGSAAIPPHLLAVSSSVLPGGGGFIPPSPLEARDSAVNTTPLQPPTEDVSSRFEAAELLKTRHGAPGPNPIRSHFANPKSAGREPTGGEGDVPSVCRL
jgi:hypothetical protein